MAHCLCRQRVVPSVPAVTPPERRAADVRKARRTQEAPLSTIQRRRRVRCRLGCEILGQGRRNERATIVALSEGGLGIEVASPVEVGEPIELRIRSRRNGPAVEVTALVWNQRVFRRGRNGPKLRAVGCVISSPPADFLALLDQLEPKDARSDRRSRVRVKRSPAPPPPDETLPRSREPMPPPKPEPEETLPCFRVRLKQVGGSRTRIVKVRAPSVAEASQRARTGLTDSGTWQVLEVLPDG